MIRTLSNAGFGRRSITDECPEAILLLVIQCLLGTLIDAFMVGCIFIKISKPKDRTDSLIFSDNAVIAQRDGKYCFMFRFSSFALIDKISHTLCLGLAICAIRSLYSAKYAPSLSGQSRRQRASSCRLIRKLWALSNTCD